MILQKYWLFLIALFAKLGPNFGLLLGSLLVPIDICIMKALLFAQWASLHVHVFTAKNKMKVSLVS